MNHNINPFVFFQDYTGHLGDLSLERRGYELWQKLSQHPCSSILQFAETKAEKKHIIDF